MCEQHNEIIFTKTVTANEARLYLIYDKDNGIPDGRKCETLHEMKRIFLNRDLLICYFYAD